MSAPDSGSDLLPEEPRGRGDDDYPVPILWLLLSLVGTAIAVTLLALSLWLEPDPSGLGTHRQLGLPPCGYLVRYGQPCMSCGMTTSFSAMAHLRIADAFRANPMGCVLFLLTLAAPFWLVRCCVRRADPLSFLLTKKGRWAPLILVSMIIAQWVLRHGPSFL